MHWERKEATCAEGVKLEPRTGSSAAAVGRKVYLYGGLQPHTGVCFGDVLVLDTGASLGGGRDHAAPSDTESNATLTACLASIYPPEKWEWSRLAVQGGTPPPRHSHAACLVGGDKLVVFGGAGCGFDRFPAPSHSPR